MIAWFLILIMYKSIEIGELQNKNRLNDFFQLMTCLIIPGISAAVFNKMIIQIWYYRPYENIFEQILPVDFCIALLVLVGLITLN